MATYPILNQTVALLAEASPIAGRGQKYTSTLNVWREHIVDPRGNPADRSINIYGWLVGWHLPVADDGGGPSAPPLQKFEEDLFWTTYPEIYKELRYHPTQSQRALRRLEDFKLVKRNPIKWSGGTKIYIELYYEGLARISQPKKVILPPPPVAQRKSFDLSLDYPKETWASLFNQMVGMLCGAHFMNCEIWIATLSEEQLRKGVFVCTKMIHMPDEFNSIESYSAFIKSSVNNGEEPLSVSLLLYVDDELKKVLLNAPEPW